ncbi:phage virion morphogenesis protein [Nesterenkonia rhizosphaerae]|uniref:Phage virion morphogenesis protein n=1 Tax=Nesterenkonia rhizosphaerae TaxID=1348272 RepID=A0ABP9FZN0_9MICC
MLSGAVLRFSGAGMTPYSLTLERFANRIRNAQPAFEEMADIFGKAQRQQFDRTGGYYGGLWKPLSPQYAAAKARTHPGKPIMVRDGQLRADLTERPFGVEHISSQRMIVGTALDRARYHQHGMGNNPTRTLIGKPPRSMNKQMSSVLHKFIVEGVPA